MKSLYIIRHAKSSWADISEPDFERSLNERGKKDAPMMAKRLVDRKINIDTFISSPATRAKKTCGYFCSAYKSSPDHIIYVAELYHASVETFYAVISKLDNKIKHAAVFSHNPGITDFVNTLCKEAQIDNMPTCAIFAVSAPVEAWKDFRQSEKQFLFFDYPKHDLN